jgi:5-hydroxyisourate hydrolase-like protein (transthyretin family)
MFCRNLLRQIAVVGLVLVLGSVTLQSQDTDKRGRKFKAPPPTARIDVTILRDSNGKPIENAAVIFHPMEGERDKGAMELKTNEDGKTMIDVLPIGDTVRLQVIAKGFQTYGQDFKVEKAGMAFEIKMKRPGEQYSIYKPHALGADPNQGEGKETDSKTSGDKSTDTDKAASDKDSSDKNSSKDKPADSSSQPSQSQPQPQPN